MLKSGHCIQQKQTPSPFNQHRIRLVLTYLQALAAIPGSAVKKYGAHIIPALLVNFLLLKLFPRFHWQRLDEFLPDLLPKLLLQLLFELLPRIFEILVLLWLHLLALFCQEILFVLLFYL